jgi:hypothetical protein
LVGERGEPGERGVFGGRREEGEASVSEAVGDKQGGGQNLREVYPIQYECTSFVVQLIDFDLEF